MIAYWLYKYKIEDKDVGVVDYVQIDDSVRWKKLNIKLPVASVCIANPFLEARLLELKPPRTIYSYSDFLAGSEGWVETSERLWVEGSEGYAVEVSEGHWVYGSEGLWVNGKRVFDKNLTHVDYSNVTLNLKDYWSEGGGSIMRNTNFSFESFEHKESYNGFFDKGGTFEKCFEIKSTMQENVLQNMVFVYNFSGMWNDLGGQQRVSISIHYPGQYLLRLTLPHELEITGVDKLAFFTIHDIEIIKGRNSRNRECTPYDNTKSFDDIVREKHIRDNNCRPQYLSPFQDFPKCSTKESISAAYYNYKIVRNKYPLSCQRLSRIAVEGTETEMEFVESTWGFGITYPESSEFVKIITQSKEVDIHTLIGNIGGYVGLFLGIHLLYMVMQNNI